MAGKAAPATPVIETESQVDPFGALMGQMDAYITEHPEAKETLRAHPVVSGIAGNIADRKVKETLDAERAAAGAAAREAQIQEQLDLAANDPDAFAAQFLTKASADRARQELEDLKAKERESIHAAIGRATREMLGDEEMTTAELKLVAEAMAGKPESEVLPAYNKAVVKVLAQRDARRLADAEVKEQVEAERKALRQESNGRGAARTPAPNLMAGAAVDTAEPDYKDRKAWNKWYEESRLKRR